MDLYNPFTNYVEDKSLGKNSHKVRVIVENLIHRKSVEDAVRFYESMAKLGIGRRIQGFYLKE